MKGRLVSPKRRPIVPDAQEAETQRLQALTQLNLLNTAPSESFDRITRMASKLFDLPIAAVSLTDQDRQWFKSRVGVDHWQIPREKSPCAEVAETAGPLVVPDLLESECYRDSLLAASGIRFYAGAPLVTREGFALGAMCVLGAEPRKISAEEQSILVDLAAMVMAQIELQHAFGRIDAISGLPNRHQLIDDLQDLARDYPGASRTLVIAELADTGRLQQAMRVLGPSAVDELVRNSIGTVRAELTPDQKLYQVGPTHFAWVVIHDGDVHQSQLEEISRSFESFFRGGSLPALMSPAIGMAPFQLGVEPAETLLRAAHSAVQDARDANGLVSIYSSQADEQHRRRFGLIADIEIALIAENQLSLVYQPKVDLNSRACVGAEALLRWQHPVYGAVSPAEFIPLVEQTELSHEVTSWVISAAIKQLCAWKQMGIEIPVSINVSPPNLEENDFAGCLIEKLFLAGLSSSALEIEVTESAIIREATQVTGQLDEIRGAGIKVSIDDFGTGYSSLSYLRDLPADTIKIDRSFIQNAIDDDRNLSLVRSMIVLAKGLNFKIVAEGIENEKTMNFLRDAGCDEGQGFGIARPLPPDKLISWLRGREGTASNRPLKGYRTDL